MVRMALMAIFVLSGIFFTSCAQSKATLVPDSHMSANPNPVFPDATEEPRRLNLYEIFPASEGRDLVIDNCTVCHSITPIVMGSKTRQQWEGVKARHVGWVSNLNEEQLDTLFGYLEDNFNPTKPEPILPQWYQDLWIGTGSELP